MTKRFHVMWLMLATLLILAACGDKDKASESTDKKEDEVPKQEANYADDVTQNPIVTITMENDKKIIAELEPKIAPNTVANFISLIEEGFYDGLIFHRVIPGFMIQGGDPLGNGTGDPGYAIAGEFTNNGFTNDLSHEAGVLSMARSQDPNSAGSQFFIMTDVAPQLDNSYAAFGKVTEGLDVAQEIVNVERDNIDKPLTEQKIKTIEVDTFGFDYPAPIKQ